MMPYNPMAVILKRKCRHCGKQFQMRHRTHQFCARLCQQRAYGIKRRDEFRAYSRKWARANPEAIMLNTCRQNARKKGQVFRLKLSDIIIPAKCPVFGLSFIPGDRGRTPSVDRIDNTKGYIPSNIQVISRRANTMKTDATPKELKQFARWIMRTYR